jgi:hypothetical protein
LKNLWLKKSLIPKQNDESENDNQVVEIEKYIDILNEMEELIVVYDAIELSSNLKDDIATAILKSIKYRVENFEQFFRPETRSAELEWCLVRSSSMSNEIYYIMFSVKIFEMWNKDDHARQLLINHKDPSTASVEGKEQDENQVSEMYSSTNRSDLSSKFGLYSEILNTNLEEKRS